MFFPSPAHFIFFIFGPHSLSFGFPFGSVYFFIRTVRKALYGTINSYSVYTFFHMRNAKRIYFFTKHLFALDQ